MSRRAADKAIVNGRVSVNEELAHVGAQIQPEDIISLDGKTISPSVELKTVVLHKPTGYICSRDGQGSKTIYDLLPKALHHLKPVGRLDKNSSGLLLLTNDGQLAQQLTHPSFSKNKIYKVTLRKDLDKKDQDQIEKGVNLEDGISKLQLNGKHTQWTVTMQEGRNRQIRRTFEKLGYDVIKLHRVQFGTYKLELLPEGEHISA